MPLSALETAAAVAAIVSTFTTGFSFFAKWSERCSSNMSNPDLIQQTKFALQISGPAVQAEFDQGIVHLAEKFAVGDGKSSQPCARLF
jgi:hypothetical protein